MTKDLWLRSAYALALLYVSGVAACAGSSDGAVADSVHAVDISGGTDAEGRIPAPAAEVEPGCVDGQYAETLPTPGADISDLIAGYSPDEVVSFIENILDRRYPVGGAVLAGGLATQGEVFAAGDCVEAFLHNKDTAEQVITSLSTLVHECGHAYDISLSGFSGATYYFTPDTQFTCQGGSIPDFGGKTFARSLIKQDAYSDLHSPCEAFNGQNCDDSYAALYLNGDPENNDFESGDQGFDMVLEEVVQYVNSLATDYAYSEYVTGSISARDGILTFLWYMERYLRMARLDFPDAYAHISGDSCWRQAILTTWGRAWLFLSLTDGMGSLGIDDAKLIGLVRDPDLLDEIQRLRDAEGCE